MIVAGVWTGVGFLNLKNSRTRIQSRIHKFWNRSGFGVWKIDSCHLWRCLAVSDWTNEKSVLRYCQLQCTWNCLFQADKEFFLTEKRYAIYSMHGSACFASWDESALGLFYIKSKTITCTLCLCGSYNKPGQRFRVQSKGSWFVVRIWTAVHIMQKRSYRKLAVPVLQPWQNSFMQLQLSHRRCHSQLSRSCVPNLSCKHFNQSYSAKGKKPRGLFFLMRQNRHYLTVKRTFKQHACMLL